MYLNILKYQINDQFQGVYEGSLEIEIFHLSRFLYHFRLGFLKTVLVKWI